MVNRRFLAGGQLALGLVVLLFTAPPALRHQPKPNSHLREQLMQLQRQSGLSLVTIQHNRIRAVSFADRTLKDVREVVKQGTALDGAISIDGAELAFNFCSEPGLQHPRPNFAICGGRQNLAIVAADGTGFREFPNLRNVGGNCWSYDDSKLAGAWSDRSQNPDRAEGLKILDLKSGRVERVDALDSFATTQCWSPDGKQIVYTLNKPMGIQIVRLYDLAERKSHDLADGGNATWSPDGKWIAYLHCPPELYNCDYDEIRPDGSERKRLFGVEVASGGLLWAPDLKMAAYIGASESDGESPDEGLGGPNELRVRSLDGQSEDWVAHLSDADSRFFQWAEIREMKQRD